VTAFALQHFIDQDEMSGAVTVVVGPKGVISAEAFGLADVAHARPMRPDCMFWIASMTKAMTGAAVMQQVERGAFGLDDPASWQEFYNPAGRDKTTIESDVINFLPGRGLGSTLAFLGDKTGRDEDHTDGKVATQAIELLEKHKDQHHAQS